MKLYSIVHPNNITEFAADEDLSQLLNMMGVYLSAQTELLTIQSRLASDVMDQASPQVQFQQQAFAKESKNAPVEENRNNDNVHKQIKRPHGSSQRTVTHRPGGTVMLNPYSEEQISYRQEEPDMGYGQPGIEYRA